MRALPALSEPGAGDGTGSPQVGLSALPARPGLRARTCSLTRWSFTCNFARSAAAAALVGKNLLARRRVWPLRTYHSNEPSAPCAAARRTASVLRLGAALIRPHHGLFGAARWALRASTR